LTVCSSRIRIATGWCSPAPHCRRRNEGAGVSAGPVADPRRARIRGPRQNMCSHRPHPDRSYVATQNARHAHGRRTRNGRSGVPRASVWAPPRIGVPRSRRAAEGEAVALSAHPALRARLMPVLVLRWARHELTVWRQTTSRGDDLVRPSEPLAWRRPAARGRRAPRQCRVWQSLTRDQLSVYPSHGFGRVSSSQSGCRTFSGAS
jgi:hypothetical protein